MEKLDCVVVGAGVIGLAVARALALRGHEVIVLEASGAIATGNSSRNSEVIHAGIHYPQNTLKATFCVTGKEALYRYCQSHHISHRRCGKLIVATGKHQFKKLEQIQLQAQANGVNDLQWLTQAQAVELEPDLRCAGALLSPSTGIIDSHAFMLSLQSDAQQVGAEFVFHAPLQNGAIKSNGIELQIQNQTWLANTVINCAGLAATSVAKSLEGFPIEYVPTIFYAKGNYFSCASRSPFSRLIYPIPEDAGLGVHLTMDLTGRSRFGPDVEWVTELDYGVDPERGTAFYNEIRKYWPQLPDGALQADYCGIRPKLSGAGAPACDFRIDDASVHGVNGLINLFGIESPGLTSALAIAEYVAELSRLRR